MAMFVIEWEDGTVEEVEQSDCATVEQYINCRFGTRADGTTAKVSLKDEAPVTKKSTKK